MDTHIHPNMHIDLQEKSNFKKPRVRLALEVVIYTDNLTTA